MSKLRAGRTFPYKLKEDRDDPEAEAFQLKVLSGEDNDTLAQLRVEYIQAEALKKPEALNRALELTVASWPWEGSLRSVLTNRECWELINGADEGAALTVDERKKFVSPPSCETDSSATDAEAGAT